MKRFLIIFVCLPLMAGCETLGFDTRSPDITLDEPDFVEAIYLDESSEPELVSDPGTGEVVYAAFAPQTMPGQLKPLPPREARSGDTLKPFQAIDTANGAAAIEPSLENYMNAIQIYPYTFGALYQVYCAPEQVTDIALEPGEELVAVSAGDTVRWVLGDTVSGSGDAAQAHILVKPVQSGLKTNLIITTSRRAYHLELQAFRETYMAAVSWRYPGQTLVSQTKARPKTQETSRAGPSGLQLDRLQFRYEISGDAPHWRPVRAFDDGRKVYIQFPARLDQGEAPPLFVIGRDGKSKLVNYRMRDHYYVVDRLFAKAELRLGEKAQDVVRIARNDLEERK